MRLAGCKPRPHQCPSPAAPPTTSAPPPVAPINLHPTPVQAPSKPKSPTGEMAAYYLQMQPHLFREAVAGAFSAIRDARDAEAAAQQQPPPAAAAAGEAAKGQLQGQGAGSEASDLVLYRRMAEVKRVEQMLAIEDLMYVCILEKFQVGGGADGCECGVCGRAGGRAVGRAGGRGAEDDMWAGVALSVDRKMSAAAAPVTSATPLQPLPHMPSPPPPRRTLAWTCCRAWSQSRRTPPRCAL